MTPDPDYWIDEASKLLKEVGAEEHLAERIAEERKARGWSQERLARELGKQGCRIPQSGIWKIENPIEGRRRAITVDEAIAFSRVFDVPLAALLLPEGALAQAALLRDIRNAPMLRGLISIRVTEYRDTVERIKAATKDDPRWVERFRADLIKAEHELQQRRDDDPRELEEYHARVDFLNEILKELTGE